MKTTIGHGVFSPLGNRQNGHDRSAAVRGNSRNKRASGISTAIAEVLESRRMLSGYTLTTLASFNGANGSGPGGTLLRDAAGNLYGTTRIGGPYGLGTVFEIDHVTGAVNTLAAFNGANGAWPRGSLVLDGDGNLYGTTESGGASNLGTFFEIFHGSTSITTRLSFNGTIGAEPYSGLSADAAGNLYGTTYGGGANNRGTVFEIAGSILRTLVSFNGGNGNTPTAGITTDAAGNLYGTTLFGGANGDGTVLEIARESTTVHTLVSFNGEDGADPIGGITIDASGNLYGTTASGGPYGFGTVFEIDHATGSVNTLAAFNGTNGKFPVGNLVLDTYGNLYGTTDSGGASGLGTVFGIVHGSAGITTLLSFNGANGAYPEGGVILDASGDIYGNTYAGGAYDYGTVFELPPVLSPSQLAFVGEPSGSTVGSPISPIRVAVEDALGNVAIDDNSTVALSILSAPPGATLGGTVTAQAVNGVATFDDLALPAAGTYVLGASDGNLATAASDSFSVAAAQTFVAVNVPSSVSYGEQSMNLAAAIRPVAPSITTVDEGTVTFMVSAGSSAIATVSAPVSGGAAVATLPLSGIHAGTYFVTANFTDPAGNFRDFQSLQAKFDVNPVPPDLSWPAPADIAYRTPLGPDQLNATATVPGSFLYTPGAGTILPIGLSTLQVTFTPSDVTDYVPVTRTVGINVIGNGATILSGFDGGKGWTGNEYDFDFSGLGWGNHQPAPIASGESLHLTDAVKFQATSFFYDQRVDVLDPFSVSFVYQHSGDSSPAADGVALVFENDPRGTRALGKTGSGLGYGEAQYGTGYAISNSIALEINLYPVYGIGAGLASAPRESPTPASRRLTRSTIRFT